MSFENQPWLGVLLIVIGLAFALLAYAVLLNRDDDSEAFEETNQDTDSAKPTAEPSVAGQPLESTLGADPEALSPDPAPDVPATLPSQPSADQDDRPSQRDLETEMPTAVSQDTDPARPATGKLLPIATLLRDETSGSLILRIGEQEYRRVGEIADKAILKRLRYAAEDLSLWFVSEKAPQPGGKPASEEPVSKPVGMIDQINAILETKLAKSDVGIRGVRLVSDPSGGVKVYIGLESYELEDVPNPQIRQLIRESVAEWEELQ